MSADGASVAAAHARLGELEREVLALTFATALRHAEVAQVLRLTPQALAEVCVSGLLELLDGIEGSSRARRRAGEACHTSLSAWVMRHQGCSTVRTEAAMADLKACRACAADLEALDRAERYYSEWGRVTPGPSLRARTLGGARAVLGTERRGRARSHCK